MNKTLSLLLVVFLSVTSFAQKTVVNGNSTVTNEQIKSALISELHLSSGAADNVIIIEDDYYRQATAIKALKQAPLKEKEDLREVITLRRSKLSGVPLSPRQVEDVMMIVENIRRKQKLN